MGCAKINDKQATTSSKSRPKMRILNDFVGKQYIAIMAQPVKPQNMTALREAFAEFDQNSDGFISKEELLNVMTNFGHMISNDELDAMIKLADNDGNGLVDFKEFLSLMDSNCLVQNVDQEVQNLFEMIDLNNDGYLSEKEISTMMKNLGEKVRKKDIRKMVKEADKNKDGKISFDEFKAMIEGTNFLGSR